MWGKAKFQANHPRNPRKDMFLGPGSIWGLTFWTPRPRCLFWVTHRTKCFAYMIWSLDQLLFSWLSLKKLTKNATEKKKGVLWYSLRCSPQGRDRISEAVAAGGYLLTSGRVRKHHCSVSFPLPNTLDDFPPSLPQFLLEKLLFIHPNVYFPNTLFLKVSKLIVKVTITVLSS